MSIEPMEQGKDYNFQQFLDGGAKQFVKDFVIADVAAMNNALLDMETSGASALPFLSEEGCKFLVGEMQKLEFRAARDWVGEGKKAVRQDFSIALNFDQHTGLDYYAAAFEEMINEALVSIVPTPCALPLRFNDRAAQIYEVGSEGISPHRDLVAFEGVVAILTLQGEADFFVAKDRLKSDPKLLKAQQGVVILMRGMNYAGNAERPYHYVENIRSRRLSFGLRFNARL